jgi:succinate dehydrogenase / fumarate reductase cytochrome b subunit
MASLSSSLASSVGRKILMSLTGVVLFGFIVGHLVGNLQLLSGDADIFNRYGHFLVSLGGLLVLVELFLIACLTIHVVTALQIAWGKRKARPQPYASVRSAGGKSRKSLGSSTMVYTGLLVLVFIVIHLRTFKYGPAEAEGYVSTIDGVEVRDLHRLVVEKFQQIEWVVGYVAAMILLGVHLSHAFWSAFQSLGFYHERYTPVLYLAGRALAVLISLGFLIIPIWIYFSGASR